VGECYGIQFHSRLKPHLSEFMQHTSSVFLVSLCLSAVLTACGGGGGGSDPFTTPPVLPPPTGSATCLPTQASFDALAVGGAYQAATKAMGCEGQLLNEVSTGGVNQKTYAWGQVTTGPYVNVVFSGDVLSIKLAQRLDNGPATSACLPAQATFGALTVGMSYTAAVATIGCNGHLLNDVVSADTLQKSYDWGNVVSGPYLQVNFKNGVLESKISQRLDVTSAPSTCLPTQANYDALGAGQDAAAVAKTMGCAGQQLNDAVVSGRRQVTLAWGDVVSGPYIQVNLLDGLFSGKISQRLNGTGAASGCLPTQANFDRLASGTTVAAAASIMGCAGQLLNTATVSGVTQASYAWGNVVSGAYVSVNFTGDALVTKLGQKLGNTGTPSVCLPTKAQFDQLATGLTYTGVEAVMGCGGELLNEVVSSGTNQKTFAWGNVVTGPYIQLNFVSDKLNTKFAQRL
jgi:hypothetical protein